jgi:hypothetical protein
VHSDDGIHAITPDSKQGASQDGKWKGPVDNLRFFYRNHGTAIGLKA